VIAARQQLLDLDPNTWISLQTIKEYSSHKIVAFDADGLASKLL